MNTEKEIIVNTIYNKKRKHEKLTEEEQLIASKYFTQDELNCMNIFEMHLSNCTCKKKHNIENYEKVALNLNNQDV
jgi:hypothetical protein